MKQWFEVSASYYKVLENGVTKKVTEPYLVDSLSFTESEATTIDEISAYIDGEFTIKAIKRSNIAEVWDDYDGEQDAAYWRIKCDFLALDEKSGNEKRTSMHILLKAPSYDKVIPMFQERMKGSVSDYEVVKVEKTAIVDVIRYKGDEKPKV